VQVVVIGHQIRKCAGSINDAISMLIEQFKEIAFFGQ
jgi:hypothetical protein